jgi:hypothetical protein
MKPSYSARTLPRVSFGHSALPYPAPSSAWFVPSTRSPDSGCHQAFKLQHSFFFGDLLNQGNFSRQAIKCCGVKLPFAVALAGTDGGPIKIAHYFRYRDYIAGIDLSFIFWRAGTGLVSRKNMKARSIPAI